MKPANLSACLEPQFASLNSHHFGIPEIDPRIGLFPAQTMRKSATALPDQKLSPHCPPPPHKWAQALSNGRALAEPFSYTRRV